MGITAFTSPFYSFKLKKGRKRKYKGKRIQINVTTGEQLIKPFRFKKNCRYAF